MKCLCSPSTPPWLASYDLQWRRLQRLHHQVGQSDWHFRCNAVYFAIFFTIAIYTHFMQTHICTCKPAFEFLFYNYYSFLPLVVTCSEAKSPPRQVFSASSNLSEIRPASPLNSERSHPAWSSATAKS